MISPWSLTVMEATPDAAELVVDTKSVWINKIAEIQRTEADPGGGGVDWMSSHPPPLPL